MFWLLPSSLKSGILGFEGGGGGGGGKSEVSGSYTVLSFNSSAKHRVP